MAAFDTYDQTVGNTAPARDPILANATLEECIDTNCKYLNRNVNPVRCALAGCAKNIPEVVDQTIGRVCNICGEVFSVDTLSANCVCPSCVSDIQRAISIMHPVGSCGK